MELEVIGSQVKSKEDFEEFLHLLLQDLREKRLAWENTDLESYLGGLHGFVLDLKGYYQNCGEVVDVSHPTWKMFADILLAARVYE
jgi:hypothetical protein